MPLTNSWPGVTGAATTTDARKNLAGLLELDATGVARSGVFPANLNAIVTARADMNVDIAAFQGVAVQFGGPILIANDGVAQLPSVLVSPGAGTNFYVIYAKQNESTAPGTDASNTRVFGAQLSTASFAAARAAMPAGALELATVQMPTAKTATNNAGVTITQTHQYTAAAGGVVPLRNLTEQNAWAPVDGSIAFRVDTGHQLYRTGGVWGVGAHTSAFARRFGATNDFNNQTSNGDFPVSADATALAGTFVKSSPSTKLVVQMFGTAQLTSGLAQAAVLAISIGGTDYDVARTQFPAATNRQNLVGVLEITGVAAGSHAVKPRFRAGSASLFQFFTDDRVSYSITETM